MTSNEAHLTVNIGKHKNNGYITDELMTIMTGDGHLTGEKLPEPIKKVVSFPDLELDMGSTKRWKIPAGNHMREKHFLRILKNDDRVNIEDVEQDVGPLDQTRIRMTVQTEENQNDD